jgi:hypothetical protein
MIFLTVPPSLGNGSCTGEYEAAAFRTVTRGLGDAEIDARCVSQSRGRGDEVGRDVSLEDDDDLVLRDVECLIEADARSQEVFARCWRDISTPRALARPGLGRAEAFGV